MSAPLRLRTVYDRSSDEAGIALVLALIVVAALTITTAALSTLVISNEKAFGRDRQEIRAFNIAEAGLNRAISKLSTLDNSTYAINSVVGPVAYPLDGGNGTWTATKLAADIWQIEATGTSPDGKVQREVAVQTRADTVVTNTPPSLAWGHGFFVASPTGCTNMVGTSQLTMAVWIRADLCLSGSQSIEEPSPSGPKRVTLYVGGKLELNGSARVGSSTRPIASATIVGNCKKGNAFPACSNASVSNVWADAYSNTASTLTKPPVDPAGTYLSGDWDNPTCSSGSFLFDTNGAMDGSKGTVRILSGSSFDCTVSDPADGSYTGRLAWNSVTRVLTIDGTIFIDGALSFAAGDQGSYQGFGTMYFNGPVTTNGNSALCGPGATLDGGSCNGLWDGSLGALAIVGLNGWSMSGDAEFNVLAYVVGNYDTGGSARVTGPVITDSAKVHGTADHTDVLNPPPGAPGAGGSTSATTWWPVRGTWRQTG